jgi:DNA-binding winged helix-turn-helix (wHTH) protein
LQQVCAAIVEHTVYVFDGFQLDVTRRKLSSAGGVVQPLNSRAMDALQLLVANAGQVIDKRRLMQAVWPAAVVEDNNLNQCILSIRRALGEAAGSNRYIMTVPGRGYCFVCPVRKLTSESTTESAPPQATWRTRAAWTGAGALAATALLLWMGTRSSPVDPPEAAITVGAQDLVMKLRPMVNARRSAVPAAAVSGCLMQRSDLSLQVEVRLVDRTARGTIWTGHYLAEAADVVAQQKRPEAGAGDCEQLSARVAD